jgi:mannosyltransferase
VAAAARLSWVDFARLWLDTSSLRQRLLAQTQPGRGLPRWALLAFPALAELVIGGYRLGGPAIWRDEAYTIDASSRSVSEIFALLRHVDAVHGLYYLLMHFVIALLGTSAQAIRLPSLAASMMAASVTAVLGRRLARTAALPAPSFTGMLAGVLLAALPRTTYYAQDARPYALVTLLAVTATWLLVRAAGDDRPRWWAGYWAALVATAAFNVFALLLVAAHGLTLLTARAWVLLRHWLAAVAAAALALSPMMYYGYLQRGSVGWLTRPGPHAVVSLMITLCGSKALVPLVTAVGLCGVVAGWGRSGTRELTPTAVTLPWLVLPAAVLLAVSQIHPIYNARYVAFSLPALALLVAAGLSWLARVAARSPLAKINTTLALAPPVLMIVLIGVLLLRPQWAVRRPNSRPDNLREVAAIITANERPGDAVLFIPPRLRATKYAYPAAWAPLRDIALARSPTATASLAGRQVSPAMLAQRFTGVDRVWLVTLRNLQRKAFHSRTGRAELGLVATMRLIGRWRVHATVLRLYSRTTSGGPGIGRRRRLLVAPGPGCAQVVAHRPRQRLLAAR